MALWRGDVCDPSWEGSIKGSLQAIQVLLTFLILLLESAFNQ